MQPTRRFALGAIVSAIALIGTAACGGSSTTEKTSDGLTKITVGYVPAVTVAPLFLGIEKGVFKKHGLDVKPQAAQGGAAIIPALVNGSMQFGSSNVPTTLTAASKGVPIRAVAMAARSGDAPETDISSVMVPKDSAIKKPEDLAGKTVAINALNNMGDLSIRAALDGLGVDSSTVKFVEIPFPDMAVALSKDRVDAAWFVEPFVTLSKSSGVRPILSPVVATAPNLSAADWVTGAAFLKESPEIVDAFVAAIGEANELAQKDPDGVRSALTGFAKLPAAVADAIVLPGFEKSVETASYERLDELARKYGFYREPVDLDQLIYVG